MASVLFGNTIDMIKVSIEDQLTSMLSEEMAKSIDREILKSLGLEPDKWIRRMNKIDKIYNQKEK
jgi:hypothetical protein